MPYLGDLAAVAIGFGLFYLYYRMDRRAERRRDEVLWNLRHATRRPDGTRWLDGESK